MTAPSQPVGGSVELARRLRALRKERSIPQRRIADALGVSVALISAWESEANPTMPPDTRIRDLATFYASERSWGVEPARLLEEEELSSVEREYRDELTRELRPVAAESSSASVLPITRDTKSTLRFPPDQDIRIVCGKLDDLETKGHPYTHEDALNYTDLLTFADADALIELFGFLRKVNPDSDIRFIRADRLQAAGSPDDFASHLILLGGVGLNVLTEDMLRRAKLPIRQKEDRKVTDAGEIFVLPTGERFIPEMTDGLLTEDIGLLARAPNPFHSGRTLTICNGIFARGVLGAVRAVTDDKIRRQNEQYLTSRFADTDRFAILMRVPVLIGNAQTPDLQNALTRLYEWRGDAMPKKGSSSREMAG